MSTSGPTVAAPVDKPAKPKNSKKYRCCYCDRAFSRSEHRSRHERSHTKERPFHCPKCPSTFVRRDLLLRHDRTVHAIRNGSGAPLATTTKKPRTSSTSSTNSNNSSQQQPLPPPQQQIAGFNSSSTNSNSNGGLDVDFNAAVLMTELQHSFHKNAPVGKNVNIPPSPPTQQNEYLPSLNYQQQQQHFDSNNNNSNPSAYSPVFKTAHSSSGSGPPPPPIQPHNNNNGNNQQHHLPPPPLTQQNNNSSSGGSHHHINSAGIHIPQFESSYSISSLLKFFSESDHHHSPQKSTGIPTRVQLNRYLSAYFTLFHPFLPFLHPQTFDPPTTAPSLIFAVCAIGALLCHENSMATALHSNSRMLVSSIFEVNKDFPNNRAPAPIWGTQSLVLSVVFASWSGDPRGLEFISSVRSSLASMTVSALYEDNNNLTSANNSANNNESNNNNSASSSSPNPWKQWIHSETIRRTYFSVFIVFGSLAAIFNYPSAIMNNEVPSKTFLPCTEWLWNTTFQSEADWNYHCSRDPQPIQFSHAFTCLVNDQPMPSLSPFAIKILSSALFSEVHHNNYNKTNNNNNNNKLLSTLRVGWENIARDTHPGQGQVMSSMASNTTFMALASSMEDEMNILFAGPSPLMHKIRSLQHPLIISGYIISLVGQSRLLIDLTNVHDTIRYHVPNDICSAAVNALNMLGSAGRLRNSQLTGLVSKCFDLYRIPCLLGIKLVKTVFASPMVGACVESLLCGFELSLILIMWCHRIEQDMQAGESLEEDEALLYSVMERTCFDCGLEKVQGQLSPALALFGADLFESNDSWGLASVLSFSLRSFGYNLFPNRPPAPINYKQVM